MKSQRSSIFLLPLLALAVVSDVQAFTLGIQPGSRVLYLRVGQGTWRHTGNSIAVGTDPTINAVAVTVPAPAVGNNIAQPMAMTLPDGQSSETCLPSEVVIGIIYRRTGWFGSFASATLIAVPGALSNGTDTIPFSQIGWVSSSSGAQAMPTGAFTGASQTFPSFAANTYFESCLTFRYANSAVVASGTYNGRVTYTLSAP